MDINKETMTSLMIDHIDGKITGELARYVELHIQKYPDARAEYDGLKEVMELMASDRELELPEHEKEIFLERAREEISNPKKEYIKSLSLPIAFKIAAAIAFVVAGYLGGKWINDKSKTEFQMLQSELRKTKELVLMSMMRQESAVERLKGVMASSEFDRVDEDIIDALIFAMNNDSNINVRIAAAEALAGFSSQEKARIALIASLNNQSFPAVQLKLIDILVSMGDKKALKPMQEFAEKEDVINSVKDEAHMGIFKLM